MKKITLITILLSGFLLNGFCSEGLADKIQFASIEKANALLTQEDEYTKSWSQFDIDARVQKKNSSKAELFEFIVQQARSWTIEEQKKMQSIFESIEERIAKQAFKIDFPDTIYFIKTTLDEEGGAEGYTRANYVVLKDNILKQSDEALEKLVMHELFHILTRNNNAFRKEMYEIIGFNLMNTVAFPESLKYSRITNPDAPQLDTYITIEVNGQPKDAMMILYSNKEYAGGSFFRYLNIGFLGLTGDTIKTVDYEDDKPKIYSLGEVTRFFEQVGKNTQYIIHPEEILAENFVLALLDKTELPNPEIVNKIKEKLKK